jgi:hypothetical protein
MKLSLRQLVRERSARSCGFALLALVGASAALVPAAAAERAVSLGEVSSRVVRADVDLESVLRSSIDAQLRDLDVRRIPGGKHVVLSAALVRMETDLVTRSVTATVSVAMRTARGGSVFALLEGRARVGLESARSLATERRAIDAAVRAALERMPEALR